MKKESIMVALLLSGVIIVLIVLDVLFHPEHYIIPSPDTANSNINANIVELIINSNDNSNNTNINTSVSLNTQTVTPLILEEGGIKNSRIEDVKDGKDLFGIRLDTLESSIKKRYIYQGDFPLGIVYEIDSSVDYETLKTLLSEKTKNSPVYKINETNTFGKRSFYLNNTNRNDMNLLLISFERTMIGFEYPKNNHEVFTPLFEYLKNNF